MLISFDSKATFHMRPLSQSLIKHNLVELGHIKWKPFHHIIIAELTKPTGPTDRPYDGQTNNQTAKKGDGLMKLPS